MDYKFKPNVSMINIFKFLDNTVTQGRSKAVAREAVA